MKIGWDQYEIALLIDACEQVRESKVSRKAAVKELSDTLRKRAQNNGIEIDELFRNTNGIDIQMAMMEYQLSDGKKGLPRASKSFIKMAWLRKNDSEQYNEILRIAKIQVGRSTEGDRNMIEDDMIISVTKSDTMLGYPAEVRAEAPSSEKSEPMFKELQKTVEFLSQRYDVKLHYDRFSSPAHTSNDILYKIKSNEKDVMWVYYIHTDRNHYISIETEPEYLSNMVGGTNGFTEIRLRTSHPCQKMMFVRYDDIKESLEDICDSIDLLFIATAFRENIADYAVHSFITEHMFLDYCKNSGMAPRTCGNYASSIRAAENYAMVKGFTPWRIYNVEQAEALKVIETLLKDNVFLEMNARRHNMLTSSFKKFTEMIGSTIDIPKEYGSRRLNAVISEKANEEIISVLKAHYEYGFKYDSIRELMRFRQFAEAMGIAIPDDDDKLKASIMALGTVIGDKVYSISSDMSQELQKIIDDLFSSGICVVYYESLFEIEHEWMESRVITSADMLKEYLQLNVDGCYFSKKFLIKGARISEKEAVTAEIKRVWGINPSVNVNELHNRLPYIPLENICRVISGNDLFVLTAEGEYLYTDLFCITEDEKKTILNFVESSIEEDGFASIVDVPLGDIEEKNYELTKLAIYNAIYKKVLSEKYHINGKILTVEKSELDIVTLLKQDLQNKDECTFDEVAERVVELNGGPNRQYAFQALYDVMVRVDRNRFVADRFVNFNIDEIDTELSGFISENFRAVREVTTFAMFPLCGQRWNHYLLESYCYKFSRKFNIHVIHFNDKNVGIIAKKDYIKSYDEILAIALAKTDVELSEENAGQYLFATGYLSKSKYAKLNEIVQWASELRKAR